ncbi:MAG: hypothetical protein HQL33_03375 [Alphaproteobacteria bacterium]|nr:hypothetical protein [Alphaproteobacteria bacterium]MBF0129012.1 hypothetical protein [Alphaproteobacteria bacterium]
MDSTLGSADTSIGAASASALVRAALLLDQAKTSRSSKDSLAVTTDDNVQIWDSKQAMAVALDNNLQLWVAVRTIAEQADVDLPKEAKANLTRLCNYIAETTFKYGIDIPDELVDTMTKINLRLAEGYLEGINGS